MTNALVFDTRRLDKFLPCDIRIDLWHMTSGLDADTLRTDKFLDAESGVVLLARDSVTNFWHMTSGLVLDT